MRGVAIKMKTRKTNKAKQVDSTCCNHGSCPYCRGNRTFSNKKNRPIVDEYIGNTIGRLIKEET